MTVVVFTGPTLPPEEAAAMLPAIYLPPARQGDLWRAVRAHRPVAIALIDGLFLHVPSVWHREILWALARGTHVFGAASMGALRAAELDRFGMRGIGRVYDGYRTGVWPGFDEPFEDDDEVAVIHAPAEAGSRAMSDAMVDLRDTLLAAQTAGVITRETCLQLAAALKRLHFGDRSFARLDQLASPLMGAAQAEQLRTWLRSGRVRRKRLDALEMLRALRDFLRERPAAFRPGFEPARTLVWERFVDQASSSVQPDEALVLDELALDPVAWHAAERAGLGRLHALRSAPAPSMDAERAQLDQFRRARGMARQSQLGGWMAANAIAEAGLGRLLRNEAALDAAAAERLPGLKPAMIDHLRLTDRFAGLLARARAKQEALATQAAPAAGPRLQAALAWYAETRLGEPLLDGTATSHRTAWASEAKFEAAVWREYLFARNGGS